MEHVASDQEREGHSRSRDQRSRERADEGTLENSDRISAIHRAAGNQAVKRSHESGEIQPKLTVSQPGDASEREAERAAGSVMQTDSPKTTPARSLDPDSRSNSPSIDPDLEREIRSIRGGGRPLSPSRRSFFEPRFGHDFGDVRVHTGPTADQAARSIDAVAFTLGTDVVFRNGSFNPESHAGKELLAHELAHVVQQDRGSSGSSAPGLQNRGQTASTTPDEAQRDEVARVVYRQSPPVEERPAHESLPKDVELEQRLENARQRFSQENLDVVRKELDQAIGEFGNSAAQLQSEFNAWANQEVVRKNLRDFEKDYPSPVDVAMSTFTGQITGSLQGEAIGSATENITKTANVRGLSRSFIGGIISFGTTYMAKVEAAKQRNEKVRQRVKEVDAAFAALDQLDESLLKEVVGTVREFTRRVESHLAAIDTLRGDWSEEAKLIEQGDLENAETFLEEDIAECEAHLEEAKRGVALARQAGAAVLAEGRKSLDNLDKLFSAWVEQQRGYQSFRKEQQKAQMTGDKVATRAFYYHPETGQLTEMTGPKVKPDPVTYATDPDTIYTGATKGSSEELSEENGEKLEQVKTQEWWWTRNLRTVQPGGGDRYRDQIDTSAERIRVYEYVGFSPDNLVHIMDRQWTAAPYHATVENGKAVSWDFDKSDHPALEALLRKFPPISSTAAQAAGIADTGPSR